MVAKRLNMRILSLASASVAGLALCAVVVTDISDSAPPAHRPNPQLIAPVVQWFRNTVEQLEAKLPGWTHPSEKTAGNPAESAATPAPADRTLALGHDITGLREAIAFYRAGDLAHGDAEARTARDALVKTTLEWVALRSSPREVGFDRFSAFQMAHPDWPADDWIRHRMEGSLYFNNATPERIFSFFAMEKPQSVPGRLALARALDHIGKTAEAAALARAVWRSSDLNFGLENKVKTEFSAYLDKADHRSRADHLLAKGEIAGALRAAALAGTDALTLTKLRIAAQNDGASDKMFAAIPAALQSDPDYSFAKEQKLRHSEKYKDAAALLTTASRVANSPVDGDDWWAERRLLARKILDLGDAETAYKLCAEQNAVSPESRLEAEFMAGWIALRFLNEPVKAAGHFAEAAGLAETPISSSRAAYWQGRAAEISPDADAYVRAKHFYEAAAAETSTYYGQLAREKLGLTQPIALRNLPEAAQGDARIAAVRTVELLFAIGEKDLAISLACKIAQHVSDERQLAALAEVITGERDAHAALIVGKILSQRHIADDDLAFPTFGIPHFDALENSAAPAVVYSVARQESAFDPNAASSAGAKGLMQLITPTAKHTAEHAGLEFNPERLISDAAFNVQLGAAHLGRLLKEHGGSYILTFAAYNAGGGRVKQWIEAYGDPRTPGVDPIDWVERIPFSETRNYVQRVMENLQVYEARLSEPQPAQHIGQAEGQLRTAAQ